MCRCEREQLAVLDGSPTHLARSLHVVATDVARKAPIDTFVEKNSHETESTRRSFASSKKATT
jgi:hypothetical protein